MKNIKKEQTDYFKVVNIDKKNNEITVLDYIFKHSDGLKGATGTKFEPVSNESYEYEMSEENVIDKIIDCGLIEYKRSSRIERIFAGILYEDMKDNYELENFCFDLSYRYEKGLWEQMRSFGFTEDQYPIFNCIGGGRCFDSKFKGNVNKHLSKLIREAETK